MTLPSSPPKIERLSPHVAERIAAGEVIERPASVVKELVENALDAGARSIHVTLRAGGKEFLEVLDNGHGMGVLDLPRAFERHATSKLRSLEDLARIHTLGFRGEALPSIAAVSDLTVVSRAVGAAQTYELNLSQSGFSGLSSGAPKPLPTKITFGYFIDAPHGTRIRAQSLFSQIPARLKFLRAQAAEVSHVREWIERLALSHPEVHFRLVSDERVILDLEACAEATRVSMILSEGIGTLVSHQISVDHLAVRLHWIQGISLATSRRFIQVVNHRAVRDRLFQTALLNPFRQYFMPGQFPAAAAYLEIDPAELDVNVHPAKTEIRFLQPQALFKLIEQGVREMIAAKGAPARPSLPAAESLHFLSDHAPESIPQDYRSAPLRLGSQLPLNSFPPLNQNQWKASEPLPTYLNAPITDPTIVPQDYPLLGAFAPLAIPTRPPSGRYCGTLFHTYLLFELEAEMLIVDQHAADERIRFERLRNQVRTGDSQTLLLPELVPCPISSGPPEQDQAWWRALQCTLEDLGFRVQRQGAAALSFQAVPSFWGTDQLPTRLKNLLDLISEMLEADDPQPLLGSEAQKALWDGPLFEALASRACHASIRAGDPLDSRQAQVLVNELWRSCSQPWNCPHGRPTAVLIKRTQLEAWFQRRI